MEAEVQDKTDADDMKDAVDDDDGGGVRDVLKSGGSRRALGVWAEERKLVRILRHRGKHLPRMGFSYQGSTWLFPEEATFLVSVGDLELTRQEEDRDGPKDLMNHADAYLAVYGGLEKHGIPADLYYVYAALKRLRFIAFRHGPWSDETRLMENGTKPMILGDGGEHLASYFKVYEPKPDFRRSDPGTPDFVVAVSRPYDRVPPISRMRELAHQCANELETSLRMAIFDGQSVSFVQIEDFTLEDLRASNAEKKKNSKAKRARAVRKEEAEEVEQEKRKRAKADLATGDFELGSSS